MNDSIHYQSKHHSILTKLNTYILSYETQRIIAPLQCSARSHDSGSTYSLKKILLYIIYLAY